MAGKNSLPVLFDNKTGIYKIGDLVLNEETIHLATDLQIFGNQFSEVLNKMAVTVASLDKRSEDVLPDAEEMKRFLKVARDLSNFSIKINAISDHGHNTIY